MNKDRSGLGFRSLQSTQKKIAASVNKGLIPAIPDTFTSMGNLKDNLICVVEGEGSVPREVCFVYRKTEGQILNNWIVVDIPEVNFIEE